jgi:hypothetical protein
MTSGASLSTQYRWLSGFYWTALLATFALGAIAPLQAAEREAAPDGAPTLARDTSITDKTQTVSDTTDEPRGVITSESRVQGQLANARVSVGGRQSYLVVDPTVGRADRAGSNGSRRVSPSQWELLRF